MCVHSCVSRVLVCAEAATVRWIHGAGHPIVKKKNKMFLKGKCVSLHEAVRTDSA